MATIDVGGVELWYEYEGDGPPLIQLHGLALGHANFAYVTPLLRAHFRVLDYDMAGFGDSERPSRFYSIQDWANEAVGLMDQLDIESAHVHATSSGGPVGLLLAAMYPERVRRLVVTASFGRYDEMMRVSSKAKRAVVATLGMNETFTQMMALDAFTRDYFDTPAAQEKLAAMRTVFAAQDPKLWDHVQELREQIDVEPLLPKVAAPTLYLTGEDDTMTPVDAGPSGLGMRDMARLTPNGVLDVIPHAGHLILGQEAEESTRRITAFLLDD